ncbi:WecB/TagA/CpsF family glycosyltransferase [Edaphobacillus lindanitolerans]|uniref:N-acetylglucosaminyldiphosphoundecaprenol N-acetyl-beta-D-mannosaminyltransferase n=1 Tax=Edaphobacillus lindanitolerans TaxID=550447 RepID=A0A1U7PHR2_9BACI|nr:WecB/TagA/CpsF family glycosyltransferase [Edaphobacillus lindanitolerans]SIT69261.1 N-acetylmannosaminyltransferase [Edaphobacillus lindanitolerans]
MGNKVKLFDVDIDDLTKSGALGIVDAALNKKDKMFIATLNPEIVMYANSNPGYLRAIQAADLKVADGIGLVVGARILGLPLKERIPGIELMEEMLKMASAKKLRVFLYGAKPAVLAKLVEVLNEKYPGIQVVGDRDGYHGNGRQAADHVIESKPDMTFVALGFPKQEQWIYDHLPEFPDGVYMGVGGSFDVLSGTIKRAPLFWRKLNLEWLYRLLRQPSRFKRFLVIPQFLLKVLKSRK